MATTDMPAGGSPDNPRDILNDISTEADRARIVLQMADARMNELVGQGKGGDVFLVMYRIVMGHLDEIERLAEAGHGMIFKLMNEQAGGRS